MAIVKGTLIALLLAGGVAAAGEPAAPAASTDTPEKPVAIEGTRPARAKACEQSSGSRIRSTPATGCRTSAGLLRTYTQEDIQRTGETDINEALRKIDPIFR